MTTSLTNKVKILAMLTVNRNKAEWQAYIAQNHLGISLAYYAFIDQELPFDTLTEDQVSEIELAFEALLAGYGILEDSGFDTLDQILAVAD